MNLTQQGERFLRMLERGNLTTAVDLFNARDTWTLREINHRAPIDEEDFYSEVPKYVNVKPGTLRASVTRLYKKGLIAL